jgi:CRISPR-associated protein (TIGR02584 family)
MTSQALPAAQAAITQDGPSWAPHHYPRRVLLLVTGLSPQVVTETLFALAVQQQPAFVPTELHVLTTTEGAERITLALLSEQPGWLARLQADWQLPTLAFDASHIHVVPDAQGQALIDLRTEADNERAADFIVEQVRRFSLDDNCALHASIAGGRKTMGYYLGYALSLYGRPQDRLSHVLVSEPFENSAEFFYPTPQPRVIQVRDRSGTRLADASQAKVMLAHIPFVRLRNDLPQPLLEGRSSFSTTVEAAQRALQPTELVIDRDAGRIAIASQQIDVPPGPLALLCLLAKHSQAGRTMQAPIKSQHTDIGKDRGLAQDFLRELSGIQSGGGVRTDNTLLTGMDGEYFSTVLSRLRKVLRHHLGTALTHQLIDGGGQRPYRYRVGLPPECIRFERLTP